METLQSLIVEATTRSEADEKLNASCNGYRCPPMAGPAAAVARLK